MNDDFTRAATAALQFLHDRLGFDLWMMLRMEDERWVVVAAHSRVNTIQAGTAFLAADAFFASIAQAPDTRIVARTNAMTAHVAAPNPSELPVAAYVAAPIQNRDGARVGLLCALDPSVQPEAVAQEQPVVAMVSDLLGRLLDVHADAEDALRRAAMAEEGLVRDSLTSLYGAHGWEMTLREEEARCHRYDHSACVIAIEVEGFKKASDAQSSAAGDQLVLRASNILLGMTRTSDVVARTGIRSFAVLGVECDEAGAEALVGKIREGFDVIGIKASLGYAMRNPERGLHTAFERATDEMKKG